jgi:hypothetical protein
MSESRRVDEVAVELALSLSEYERVGGRSPREDVLEREPFRALVTKQIDTDLGRPAARWQITLQHGQDTATVVGIPGGGWKVVGRGFDAHAQPLNIPIGLDRAVRPPRGEAQRLEGLHAFLAPHLRAREQVVAMLHHSPALVVTSERVFVVAVSGWAGWPQRILATERRERVLVTEWYMSSWEGDEVTVKGRVLGLMFVTTPRTWHVELDRCQEAFKIFQALHADHYFPYWNGEAWTRHVNLSANGDPSGGNQQ